MSSTEPCMDDVQTVCQQIKPRQTTTDLSSATPPRHMASPPSSPGQPSGTCSEDAIPVVDLAVLVNGDAGERSQAVQHLGRACQDWGFFMVTNHGVPEALQSALMDACSELFSLPPEQKQEHMDAGPMDPVRVGTGFNSAVDGARYWRDYVKMFAHPELHCPAKPDSLRGVAAEYAARTRGLLLELTAAISESLGLHVGRIAERLDLGSCFQILVGNHYPPCAADSDDDDGAIGLPAHSDHGLLTLLFQNGVDGLQVKHHGRWLLAKPLPGSFFVIAGDQLEIVSNGRYKGVLHRALVDRAQARMSCVSLLGPCLDAVVEPGPELAVPPLGLEFRGVKYRDYMEHQQSNKLNEKGALDLVRVQRHIHTTDTLCSSSIY
ncbi:2-oxoglutarate-dependent dioxygenase 19 [Triticum aestivum]|uniref:Fe2OG dioxygenase domain-containing protein n=1 Tax=Triticum aestivum TaxID=4565 RepID=A0A3B6LGP0_WHEAT|nr:2-oxoglutarate-dependent dioxygenase 19-like [Triticum aestivum]